jgi:electron transfer flavoprotein alpha subunit
MAQLFAYILHRDGNLDDTALELAAAAKAIHPDARPTAVLTGDGDALEAACAKAAGLFAEVWKVGAPELAYPNAEAVRKALVHLLPPDAVVLLAHEHLGMDLAPGLSIRLDSTYAPDVTAVDGLDGATLKVQRQEFGGAVSTHVTCDVAGGAVLTLRPGAFAGDGAPEAGGSVVDKSGDAGDLSCGRRFLEVVEAETGDVDITKSDVLVSVGRGIEDEDNLEIAHELARAMGAEVSCSRPIVDAKWLEKSRQVGTSGKTVKPKVYLACGISGSFQHMGGVKGNPFIVAINKNPKAPIFQVADVGVVADILEFMPALAEKLQEG